MAEQFFVNLKKQSSKSYAYFYTFILIFFDTTYNVAIHTHKQYIESREPALNR